MMVVSDGSIKSGSVAQRIHSRQDPERFQHSECSVHCVQRNGGDSTAHPVIDGFRVGMLVSLRNLSEDFHALVRHSDSGCPTSIAKSYYPAVKLFSSDGH